MGAPDNIDYGALAQAGLDVQAVLDSPGWKVIEDRLAEYSKSQLHAVLGKASENDEMVQFQLGRIRAAEVDIPALIRKVVDDGRKADSVRVDEENSNV